MIITSFLVLVALTAASPIGMDEDYGESSKNQTIQGVSEQEFSSFKFYSQHAGAAYCNSNAAPGTRVTCEKKNCPLVEQNNVTIVSSFGGQLTGIAAYVAIDKLRREIVLSVRGSNNLRNFITDVNFIWRGCALVKNCFLHSGFLQSWDEIQDAAKQTISSTSAQNPGFRVVATGHSLGGAVATLAAAYLRRDGIPVDIFSYGSPRVGNGAFAQWMTKAPGAQWRVTHADDPVPRLPPIIFGYRHISPEYWLVGVKAGETTVTPAQVKVCPGIANTQCNAGTFGLNIPAHLDYLGPISECGPPSIQLRRRDDVDKAELERRLNDWSRKDQEFVKEQEENSESV